MELQIASAVVQDEDNPNGASGEGTAWIDESEARVDGMVESVNRGEVRSLHWRWHVDIKSSR